MTVERKKVCQECIIAKCKDVLKENPENRCCKYVLQYLATEEGKTLKDEGSLLHLCYTRPFIKNMSFGFIVSLKISIIIMNFFSQ